MIRVLPSETAPQILNLADFFLLFRHVDRRKCCLVRPPEVYHTTIFVYNTSPVQLKRVSFTVKTVSRL